MDLEKTCSMRQGGETTFAMLVKHAKTFDQKGRFSHPRLQTGLHMPWSCLSGFKSDNSYLSHPM